MTFIDNEEIKQAFDSELKYQRFISSLMRVEEAYHEKYGFLGLRPETWDKLFLTCALRGIKSESKFDTTRKLIKEKINDYIKSKIENKDIRIFNNLIIILARKYKSRKELILVFFSKLRRLHINITEELYKKLKSKSKLFHDTVKGLGIANLTLLEIEEYVSDKNSLYRYLKPLFMSYQDIKDLVANLLRYYPKGTYAKLNQDLNSIEVKKLKYLIDNYEILNKMYFLFFERLNINRDAFDFVIVHLSKESLKELIASYRLYSDNKQDNDFLNMILQRCCSVDISEIKKSKKSKEKTIQENDLKFWETLYNLFPNYPEVSLEEKKRTVDMIFNNRSKRSQEIVRAYLRDGVSSDKYPVIINSMVKLYIDYHKVNNGKRAFLGERKEFYDRFPDYIEISREMKRQIIDSLVLRSSREIREAMRQYFACDVKSSSYDGCRACSTLGYLGQAYNEIVQIFTNTVLEIITNIPDISSEKAILESYELILLECRFRYSGYNKNDYLKYKNQLFEEIKEAYPNCNGEQIIRLYIEAANKHLQGLNNDDKR